MFEQFMELFLTFYILELTEAQLTILNKCRKSIEYKQSKLYLLLFLTNNDTYIDIYIFFSFVMIKKQCANCPSVISLTIFRSQHLCKRGFVNICDCISRVHIDPDISAGTVQPCGCQRQVVVPGTLVLGGS